MNRVSKLLALLLAFVLSMGVFTGAVAEGNGVIEYPIYVDMTLDAAIANFTNLTPEKQYAVLVALGDDTAKQEELIGLLSEEQIQALASYVEEKSEAEKPAVNYANVADFRTMAPPMRMNMLRNASAYSTRSTTNEHLHLSKNVEVVNEKNREYKITLEAYATGTINVTESTQPCDIVLVLDMSTSMKNEFSAGSYTYTPVSNPNTNNDYYLADGTKVSYCSSCRAWTEGCLWIFAHISGGKQHNPASEQFYTRTYSDTVTRLEALKTAANSFIDTVSQFENNSVAIVGFHSSAEYLSGTGTNAFKDPQTNATTLKGYVNGIGNSDLKAATDHNDGLNAAIELFKTKDADSTRKRIVILFTDGEPEPLNSGTWSPTTVKEAVNYAYELKNTYGAALYSVSVAPNTNAANPSTPMDMYMDYMSSNYPSARYTGYTNIDGDDEANVVAQITPGNRADTNGKSFYLTAGDVNTLVNIFEEIANQTGGTSVALDATAEIRDIVTPYFNVPAGSAVSVKTYDCTSYVESTDTAQWSTTGTPLADAVTIDGDTLTVTGFDFNRNFVAEKGRVEGDVSTSGSFHGRKIVIEFNVTAKDEFWGGNNVPTNGDTSGIYAQGADTAAGLFDVPQVNVPLNIPALQPADYHIYLKGDAPEVSALYNSATFANDGSWQKAYVDITTSTATSTGTLTDVSNTEDTVADITVTVEPETEGSVDKGPVATEVQLTGTAHVYVYKPEFTFKDSSVKYMVDTVENPSDFDANNKVSDVVWKHGTDIAVIDAMTGNAPTEFAFNYTLVNSDDLAPNGLVVSVDDIPVKVTKVTMGPKNSALIIYDEDTNVNLISGFVHQNCDPACGWTGNGPEEFLLHVTDIYGYLTITKTGMTSGDVAIFYVKGPSYEGYVEVPNNGSNTLKVRVGEYEITEQGDWTWRYETTVNETEATNAIAEVNGGNTPTVVDFVNGISEKKWLDGSHYVTNVFGDNAISKELPASGN